jgi:hypothetical protein
MKASKILLSFMTLFLIFSTVSCKKNKNIAPIDQLPPETQTGKNTFGCLVDGKVFLPKGPSLAPILAAEYQFLNTNYSKGYFWGISATSNGKKDCELYSISLATDSLSIEQGKSYALGSAKKGSSKAQYRVATGCGNSTRYLTNDNYPGELRITKLDEINQIVSGTFWFYGVNENGDTVKVTNGRFDMQFTK